jgi:50S ribosomal protein L16 3-hydroxylase
MTIVVIDTLSIIIFLYIIKVIFQTETALILGFTAPNYRYSKISTRWINIHSTTTDNEFPCTDVFDKKHDARNGSNTDEIPIVHGPFHSTQLQDYWGKRPLLIRDAFPLHLHKNVWPSWDDIIQLSCNEYMSPYGDVEGDHSNVPKVESGESARFIQHVSGKLDTFTLDMGPFDRHELQRQMAKANSGSRNKLHKVWTLLHNDIERYCPALDAWMNEYFHFLPRWRRDDAQVSCTSSINGGIGPHVDNYDVCLIQISGKRLWRILLVSPKDATMSHSLEERLLIPNIPVSVLNLKDSLSELKESKWIEILVKEGDLLYLPPRFVHWGLGQSTDCMTLSVGARAPSSSDLLIRITEHVQQVRQPISSQQRYKDVADNLIFWRNESVCNNDTSNSRRNDTSQIESNINQHDRSPTLSTSVKESMKLMVQKMIDDISNDESMWDMIVGKLITDPLRYSDTFPIPYPENMFDTKYHYDNWKNASPSDVVQSIQQLGDQASLCKVAGISSATSQLRLPRSILSSQNQSQNHSNYGTIIDRIYVHGEMYEVIYNNIALNATTIASIVFQRIDDSLPVYGTMLQNSSDDGTNPILFQALQQLLEDGIIVPHYYGAIQH